MSTGLALGAVSAVLRNVLDNGLIDAGSALQGSVRVSVKAPDLIKLDDPQAAPQLNLFLHRVSPNPAWRNMDLPSRDTRGDRITNPPLALNLHYLLTAYGREDLHAEILLGYGMQLLHERPFLDRAAIRKALSLVPLNPNMLPEAFRDPPNAGLAEQFETLKITPEPLDVDGMSKLWSAVQTHYRPSAAYEVSVVLIEAVQPAADPLPVLTRGLTVTPSPGLPYPAIESVVAPDGTSTAELGETVTVHGHRLAGTGVTVRLAHRLLPVPHEIAIGSSSDPGRLSFTLPAGEPSGQVWPAGVWRLTVTLTPVGGASPRTTNTAALMLAPDPDTGAATVTRDPASGRLKITFGVTPRIRPEQPVTVALNSVEATVSPRDTPAGQVEAEFATIPAGDAWLRLRVDGVRSRLIDDSGPVPVFRTDRKVTVP
ncbi:DUF4255 domain-containing protein [Spongiactinospora sp. TRM90649]|uniref:DUF4255 domain-containing protein n=1 Tax=Spongiactinospora sp. TRM90649 TaxID=3031114 RepID=UPI0023F9010D|nr:DUF4255 domain-containing protein [Spongiactinospora sp. TRM90649]MDF5753119.1 DUF4255 domain-containing protein [Spongiactinospora sp. TRM90649]